MNASQPIGPRVTAAWAPGRADIRPTPAAPTFRASVGGMLPRRRRLLVPSSSRVMVASPPWTRSTKRTADVIAGGQTISTYCVACGHQGEVDPGRRGGRENDHGRGRAPAALRPRGTIPARRPADAAAGSGLTRGRARRRGEGLASPQKKSPAGGLAGLGGIHERR
jgi:hypothetical protein